jgi:hypothetical protein
MKNKMVWKGFRRPLQDENLVIYKFEDDEFWANLPLFLKEVNHSPTGFEWGYNGSGPAQLAYAILRTYFLGQKYTPAASKRLAQKYYQNFKNLFISSFKGDEWEISSEDITSVFLGGERVGWE